MEFKISRKQSVLDNLLKILNCKFEKGFPSSNLSIFHLIVHAFFKALLFIRAGHLIHNMQDYQDLRRMGRAGVTNPLSGALVCLTKASLCGLPFYSSFYSKEFILERLTTRSGLTLFVYLGMWVGVLLTLLYSRRFILLVLRGRTRTSRLFSKQEQDGSTILRIRVLVVPSASAGKFLHVFQAPYLGLNLEGRAAKAGVLSLLAVGVAWASRPLMLVHRGTNKNYIWALPFWTGGLRNSVLGRRGYSRGWLRNFRVTDLILVSWVTRFSDKGLLFQAPRLAFFRLGVRIVILFLLLLNL